VCVCVCVYACVCVCVCIYRYAPCVCMCVRVACACCMCVSLHDPKKKPRRALLASLPCASNFWPDSEIVGQRADLYICYMYI
jgi:hypothetical protein